MRIKLGSGLLPINLFAWLLIAAILLFPYDALRITIGIPFVLFFPGYALMAALFPGREGMGGIERVALSFGLSIAVVALILLILNYTPWGIRLESILYSVASFIFITSIVAWGRRKRLANEERFSIEFRLGLPGRGGSAWDKALSVILALAIVAAFATVGYVIAKPSVGQKFTEFYVLELEGKAADYPRKLVVGEEGRVTIGIINNEHEVVSYQVEVSIDGFKNNEVEGLSLEQEERWENEVSFTPQVAGDNQKVEFLLYKNGESTPCFEPLRLWVNVTE